MNEVQQQHAGRGGGNILWYSGLAAAPVGVLLAFLGASNDTLTVAAMVLIAWSIVVVGVSRRRRRGWVIHLTLLLVLGTASLLWVAGKNRADIGPDAKVTVGVVTTMTGSPLGTDPAGRPLFCSYVVDGLPYLLRLEEPGYAPGDTVRVRYAPDNPFVAEVDTLPARSMP